MRSVRRVLSVTSLEDRLAPAAIVRFLGGGLTVNADAGFNVIDLTAQNGSVAVRVNDVPRGSFAVTGNVVVTLGAGGGVVLAGLNGTSALPGDLTVTGAGGEDEVRLFGLGTGGTVAGRLTFIANGGDDLLSVVGGEGGGGEGLVADGLPQTAGAGVGGATLFEGGTGFDTFTAGSFAAAAKFGGPVTLTRANLVLTSGPQPGATSFAGPVVMNSAAEVLDAGFFPDNTLFAGDLTVMTGGGDDNLTPIFGNTFAGRVTFMAGAGDNESVPFGDNNFLGDFLYMGGAGADFFVPGQPHAGSVFIDLGAGDNGILDVGGWTVGGNLTIRAGAGADDLGTLNPTVGGALTIMLGDGANTANIRATSSGTVRYVGGSGVDRVTVGGVNNYRLYVSLGAGDDSFAYAQGTVIGGAIIDFGLGTDTFDDGGAPAAWPQVLLNLI
jgi:hypothetical protein